MGASGSGDVGRRLLELKKQLEQEKQQRSEMQGELRSLMSRLEEEFGAKSLEDAQAQVKEKETALATMEQELAQQVEEIQLLMEGDDDD